MDKWQKEAIKRFRELHPEISDETWNEVINSVGDSFNHTIKIETLQPLFTLTAEEVETIRIIVNDYYWRLMVSSYTEKNNKFKEAKEILNKIKEWQDENNRTD